MPAPRLRVTFNANDSQFEVSGLSFPTLYAMQICASGRSVLGTGCHNCLELEMRLAEAVTKSGRSDVEVERLDDERIIRHHIPLDAIPGLLIDGRLVSQREALNIETLLDWLKAVPA